MATAAIHIPDAGLWADTRPARSVCARINPSDFVWHRSVRGAGDIYVWSARNSAGEQIECDLGLIRDEAVIAELGSDERDAAWFERAIELPSISEAIEAEFARRDGRVARTEWRPAPEYAAAYREMIGAGIPNVPPVSARVIDVSELPEFKLAREHLRRMREARS